MRICWKICSRAGMYTKSDLEPSEHHTLYKWYMVWSPLNEDLVWIQDSSCMLAGMISETSIFRKYVPCMTSASFVCRKYIAWYDFRILYIYKVCCLVWFQDPVFLESILPGIISGTFVIRQCILESWPCVPLVNVLARVSTPPGICCKYSVSSKNDYHSKWDLKRVW